MDPVKLLLYVIEYIALVSRYCYCKVTLVVSDSVRPHRQQPNRLPGFWDFPGKNTGVGCYCLLWVSR